MSCLILRAYLKTTYRGIIELLEASDGLRKCLGLDRLPHYSTLKRFADRSAVPEIIDALLGEVLGEVDDPGDEVAMDSTGVKTSSASAHYRTGSGKHRKQYVKISLMVTFDKMLATSMVIGWGPRNDKSEARELLERTQAKLQPRSLFADAGYDAEWVHRFCPDQWGVRSYIPPAVHRLDGTVNGKYRSRMTRLPKKYGRRWHVESFISGLKRATGSCLSARNESALFAEAALRVLAYAIRR